jgi:hypothetical protein
MVAFWAVAMISQPEGMAIGRMREGEGGEMRKKKVSMSSQCNKVGLVCICNSINVQTASDAIGPDEMHLLVRYFYINTGILIG